MPTVLAIDDDRSVLHLITQSFKDSDFEVLSTQNAEEGIEIIRQQPPDVVLLDIMLPKTSGLAVFQQIRDLDSKLPIIFITAGGASDTAIEAMKLGAYDYLLKPLKVDQVKKLVAQATEMRRLMNVPVEVPQGTEPGPVTGDLLVGRSPAMLEVYKSIGQVAREDVTVLVRGESGTGKELVARALYHHSRRSEGPFLAVNCAAIPESLLESELFGHEKGSFTGATSRRIGKFEQCDGGTLFLDEVGDMSPMVQSKVLRLLQEQRFERVGGNQTIQTDVRVIAATNRDLEEMAEDGEFRSDLYYRLNGFSINLPPLRERGGDIMLLIDHFFARFNRELVRAVQGISPEALNMLTSYHWPGNVRELQSALRQAMLQSTGPLVMPEFLPDEIRGEKRSHAAAKEEPVEEGMPPSNLHSFVESRLKADSSSLYAESLEMMERYLVTRVLRMTEGNQSKAAEILGITRGSLRNKIRSLGISIDREFSVGSDAS